MFTRLRNFFLPHTDNDHHPLIWKNEGVIFFIGLILLTEGYFLVSSYLLLNNNSFLAAVYPGALVAMTNDVRVESKLNKLTTNETLAAAAQLKANDMASRGYFSHYTPEGLPPWTFISKAGYNYAHAGENLAINFVDSKDVVDAWVKSPTHYANIIKDTYTEIGIATAEGKYEGRKTIFVVEFFGTPKEKTEPEESPTILAKAEPKQVAAPIIPKTTKKAPEPILVAIEMATTTAPSTTLAISESSTTAPQVFGAETDSNDNLSQAGQKFSTPLFLTYPKHITTIVLTILIILTLILLGISIKEHNKEHHGKIFISACYFIVISLLVILFNQILGTGTIL